MDINCLLSMTNSIHDIPPPWAVSAQPRKKIIVAPKASGHRSQNFHILYKIQNGDIL